MRILAILFLMSITLESHQCFAQAFNSYTKAEKDSIKRIDYINKSYTFLDSNFNIDIDDFETLEKSGLTFDSHFIYKDSLRVILKYNLQSDYATHLAFHRILKKWENVSFYLWMTPSETEKLAKSMNIVHPHLFYQYLVSEQIDDKKSEVFKGLQNTLSQNFDATPSFETNKALLKFAFKHNPDREKAMKAYFAKEAEKHKKK